MIARRRRVGVLESDVSEYLVDNGLIGDKRDDPHCPAAAPTQERILLPDLPNELRPSHAPRFQPSAFIAVGVIGRAYRCLVSAARHPALSGGVRVEAVVEHESFMWLGDVHGQPGDEVEDVQLDGALAVRILSLPANDRAVEELFSKYGLHEGEQAHRFLSSLVFGDFPKLEGIDTLAAAAKSLPLILDRISRTPAPELTLRNFVRIVKASGAVRSTLELLGGSGDLLRLLLAVTSLSSRLSDILANRIELLDFLAEGAPPGESPDPKAVDALMRLARRQEEALLIVHSRNPIPEAGPETLGPLLTEVSERALAALFDRHLREERGIAVLAAGSLATRCAHFGSDLDIIAVTTDERSASRKDDVIHAILDDARAMRLGPVDMRLRGEGESAPLVQTLDYYEGYFQTRASLGEIVAYSKCRFIRGDAETGRAFEEMLARTLSVLFSRKGWKGRLIETRAKLASLSKSAWDVKHAPGGLYDIDFLLSATRLLGLVEHAAPAGRGEEIERLREAGLLEAEDAATLAAAYRVFWTIEHAAALHGIPYPPLPEREDFFESYFDRLFGAFVPGDGTFLKRLGGIRENVRRIFEHFIERAE